MKASELRIGNYIARVYKVSGMICKVDSIDIEGCKTTPLDPLDVRAFHYDISDTPELMGISICEEWLLKFGFELDSICNQYHIDNFYIDEDYKWVRILATDPWEWVSVECDSIHKLQNLYYAVKGIELTIK